MNKLTKGSLATGAGLVLLLGGTGTFMSWNDSGTADGGQVTAGHLIVNNATTGTWSSSISGAVTDIAAHEIVPGETLTYTADLGVDAVGENLQVTADLSESSVVAVDPLDPEDVALAKAVTDSAALTVESQLFTASTTPGVFDLTADGTGTVTVAATIAFPDTAANATQDGQVDLTAMTVTLDQALNQA